MLPGPAGMTGTAERERAALENAASGRQVVGEAVDHDLAAFDPRRGEGSRRAPGIVGGGFRLVDAAGRGEQAPERARRRGGERPERRLGALHLGQGGLAQHGNEGEVGRRAQVRKVDVAELAGERAAPPMQFAEPVA